MITNSNKIVICDEAKAVVQTKLESSSRITAATVYDKEEFKNCIACVNTNSEFMLWDLRQKRPAL